MRMTGGEALANQLVGEGVHDVFGVPGVQLDFAVDGLARVSDRIRFVNTRHEQGAAYFADGYARSSDQIGVCLVVPGPGLLNALAGLSTAYACSSPVLVISGQIPSATIGKGLGMLHEIPEQSHTLGTLTKWQGTAHSPEEIPGLVREAFRQLRSGRPRPVGIEIPPDVLQASGEVTLVQVPGDDSAPLQPDSAQVTAAASLLRAAERPVIYVGGGVLAANASVELAALASALQAPVVMSPNGRGSLSDRHPLALTSLGGREVLPEADVVLVVGSRFLDGLGKPVATAAGAKLIHLNAEAADFGPPRTPAAQVHADARLGLAALTAELDGLPARESAAARVAAVRGRCLDQISQIQPQWDWVRALRAGIPEDGILVNELTQVGYLSQLGYEVYSPRSYLTPGYQGTLGYGFATALGAKVANPDRPVVSISGDGGFGWNLQELATARRFGIGLVTVVFNDNAFGNVRRTQQTRFDGRVNGTELANPDFVKLADAFGITGTKAETPAALEGTLKEACNGDEPVLVEVPVGPMPSAWHLIHDFLAKPKI